jgi:hypothetical protein
MGAMNGNGMKEEDRLAIERLRVVAARHRQRAALYAALGAAQEALNSRAIADFQDERALSLVQRAVTASLPER